MFDGVGSEQPGQLRLAIISTYDELCGIAGYTRALEQTLRPHAAVTVFDLDQYLLRSPHARVQRLGDVHIKEIAGQLHAFDSVNIQLEYGTLGRTNAQILRRLRWLMRAAPALSVTFHTVLGHEVQDWRSIGRNLATGRIFAAGRAAAAAWRGHSLAVRTYALLRSFQRRKSVACIMHTRRDARLLHDVYRIRRVYHHPLSFVGAGQAVRIREEATRDRFPVLRTLPETAKLIGTFGFLSPYKGFETALRALRYLPDDYHLLIFGGIHPQTIKRDLMLDPYIGTLFAEARIGQTILDSAGTWAARLSLTIDAASRELLTRHPEDLQRRVHFLGVHDDAGFMAAMALCNTVVLPYLEVGQSSSGPIAMALDMGCRVVASRTLAFLQFARYHPGLIEFFDIGNYAELADLLRAEPPAHADRRLVFNTETNAALYLEASHRVAAVLQPHAALGAPLPGTSPAPLPATSPAPLPATSPAPLPATSPAPLPATSPAPLPATSPAPLPATSLAPLPATLTPDSRESTAPSPGAL